VDHEPSVKKLGHIQQSSLIVDVRLLRTSVDINSEKNTIEVELRAKSVLLHPLSHNVAHTGVTGDIELAVNDCRKLDFVGPAFQGVAELPAGSSRRSVRVNAQGLTREMYSIWT
jgi:hypothetical protein